MALLTLDDLTSEFEMNRFSGRQFACLVLLDGTPATTGGIANFCGKLLDLDCAWLSAWGAGCERVHDIMDEIVVDRDCDDVMTTWHDDETIGDTVELFLTVSGAEIDAVIVLIGGAVTEKTIQELLRQGS